MTGNKTSEVPRTYDWLMRHRRMAASIALLTVIVTAACSSDPGPQPLEPSPAVVTETPSGSPTPSASQTLEATCDASDPALLSGQTQGRLTGDVDGDGTDDEVSVALDPSGEPGCRSFIVVETSSGTFVAPTDPDGSMAGFEPQLRALVQADDQPGSEIVAQVLAGASTQFIAMFTLHDGALARVSVEPVGAFGDIADLFPYGGSVGHMEASDCAADGRIVISAATPAGGSGERYEVQRVFLRFEGSELIQDEVEKQVVSVFKIEELPEYRSSPFGSCPTS